MMQRTQKHSPRPTQTQDLIRRLMSSDSDPKEKEALQALSKRMIEVFENDRRSLYMPEIAELSSVTTDEDYGRLVIAVANAIIEGTKDESILKPTLLIDFVYVLRRAEGIRWAKTALAPVMASLQKRLNSAVEQAEPETQYRLICTLSTVLDSMIDIKTSGLKRELLHEPLLTLLKNLSTHRELRLAQAACYAHQALLGISDNEGPYQALWRHMLAVGEGTAKVAGAASSMNPAKLFDAIPDLMKIPNLIKSVIDVINGLGSLADGMKSRPKQKEWYFALRYTDMLIQADAFDKLEDFIQQVPCRERKEFMCGLYAQLEQAGRNGDSNTRGRVIKVLQQAVIPIESTNRRVQEWDRLVAETLECPDPSGTFGRASRWPSWKRERKYERTLKRFLRAEMKSETCSSSLLENAWSNCPEAQLYYAAAALREYYSGSKRLEIQRLSGEQLPMAQCYINLAIIENSSQRSAKANSAHQPPPFSIFARLKVESVKEDMQVSLPALFSPRKQSDGNSVSPSRILIRGHAGVGKTTLCKKIVHDYIYHKMWQEQKLFHWLLWVPLRRLKGKSRTAYNLGDLFYDEYFSQHPEGKDLAKALWKEISKPDIKHRTLFLLDGLDEISQEWSSETPMDRFLQELLGQPKVIITSRPYGMSLNGLKPDLELETIGFSPNQVETYLRNVIDESQKVNEIQLFVKSNPLIQGLIRIPIQLDALCYSWRGDFVSRDGSKTMTTIYKAIVLKLWQKDIPRLELQNQEKPLTEHYMQDITNALEIEGLVQNEINLLEGLAFAGLYNEVIEFNAEDRGRIYEHLKRQRSSLPSICDSTLKKLSFLRTSDDTLGDNKRSYHFFHLTFQEFFAAQYFVRHWVEDRELSCLVLSLTNPEVFTMTPQAFLQKEKYNSRYDILWRFVAGLLHAGCCQKRSTEDHLKGYFQELEAEPRDLLGPAHQRILMHSFSEVSPSRGQPGLDHLRANMKVRLSRWVLFECNSYEATYLARQRECPEDILNTLLREGSERVKRKIFAALNTRPSISLDIIHLAESLMKYNTSKDLKIAAFEMLVCHHKLKAKETLESFVLLLKDPDLSVRFRAAKALDGQTALPKEIIESLVLLLKDPNVDVWFQATEALCRQSALPKEIFESLVLLLKNPNLNVGFQATEVLVRQPALPKEILESLVLLLTDPNLNVRLQAAEVLGGLSTLPKEILESLVLLLKDPDRDAGSQAAEALSRLSALPKEILESLGLLLKDSDDITRSRAAEALGEQSTLPKEIIESLVLISKDPDDSVRFQAAEALGRQSALPKEVLESLNLQLKDPDDSMRFQAAKALGRQSALPKEVLESLNLLLKDPNLNVRYQAAGALGRLSALPKEILESLALLLMDPNLNVRHQAAEALGGQLTLPKEILESLVLLLKDTEHIARFRVAEALGRQSALPKEVLKSLVLLLKGPDGDVRFCAAEALGGQSALPEEILESLALLLKDPDEGVRYQAAKGPTIRNKSTSDYAEKVLKNHEGFYSIIPNLHTQCLKTLFRIWMKRSFREQVSCYLQDKSLYIDMPEGLRRVPFESFNQEKFKLAIQAMQVESGIPSREMLNEEYDV